MKTVLVVQQDLQCVAPENIHPPPPPPQHEGNWKLLPEGWAGQRRKEILILRLSALTDKSPSMHNFQNIIVIYVGIPGNQVFKQ